MGSQEFRLDVDYIAQPDTQLGNVLSTMLDFETPASRIVFVSPFVALQTIMRIKSQVGDLRASGTDIRFILGIDLDGTSQEVLKELLDWNLDVRIVKHRIPGHTFHPKLYLFEWGRQASIIVGSNNLTEGGFFKNYEGALRVTYRLPTELELYRSACTELKRFLDPAGPTVYQLTPDFLDKLIARGEVPTEARARIGRDVLTRGRVDSGNEGESLFGVEDIPLPPPLPANLLDRLVKAVRARRRSRRAEDAQLTGGTESAGAPPIDVQTDDALLPAAFYMTLPTLQGPSIPGEARIPLEAIELAREFWGWPDKYTRTVGPRGSNRVYWNWRPQWRIWSVEDPGDITVQEVRMYMYEDSSDFRFYVRPLVNAGADLGDIVRIRRIAEPDGAEYECVLSRRTTPEYAQWIANCTQPVRNSPRRFGYA